MTNINNRTALVLGATGGVGGEIAAALLRRGWTIRAVARDPSSAKTSWPLDGIQPLWVKGDAMESASVVDAAQGCSVIVHAVNPPGYRNWDRLVLPMLDSTIEAAKGAGARIVLPASVYNFGPDAFADPHEDAPQNPPTRKSAIKVEMERRLRAAGIPSLVVRCGDFFGPHAANNWFSQGLVKPGRPVRSITYPGKRGVGHQWAYLPDVGETVARLVERRHELEGFEVFHMQGHWDPDGTRMVEAIRKAADDPDIPVRAFPWLLARLAEPFVPLFREIREMRYLWQVPLRMRNDRLQAFLGAEPHTDWETAVRATLAGIGCLDASAQRTEAAVSAPLRAISSANHG